MPAAILSQYDTSDNDTDDKGADNNESYDDDVTSAGQLDDRGHEPIIAGEGPLKKARSGEVSSLIRLDPMRAHSSTRGGGGAGVDTIDEDDLYDYKAEEASFLFRLNRERAHTSAKGAPSTGVEAVDDDDLYDNDVASAGQPDNRGCEPEIAGGGGPLKKEQSGEASSLFHLDPMRAHASTKGGGSAGVDTVNEDNLCATKPKRHHSSSALTATGRTCPLKGGPVPGVEAIDDDDLYGNNVASARQLDDRGPKPEIVGGGASQEDAKRRGIIPLPPQPHEGACVCQRGRQRRGRHRQRGRFVRLIQQQSRQRCKRRASKDGAGPK